MSTVTQLNAVSMAITALATSEEINALHKARVLVHGAWRLQAAEWTRSKCLDEYKDLEARVLPVFWRLLWDLIDYRNAAEASVDDTRRAKKEAYDVLVVLTNAFKYLMATKQFRPRGQDMWEQVRFFAAELGNRATNRDNHDSRCRMRKEMLKHMFRGLAIHKGEDTSDWTNSVTVMCLLLDRIDLSDGLSFSDLPWKLPAFKADHKYPGLHKPTAEPQVDDNDFFNDIEQDVGDFQAYLLPRHDEEGILKQTTASRPEGKRDTYFGTMSPELKGRAIEELEEKFAGGQFSADLLEDFKKELMEGKLTANGKKVSGKRASDIAGRLIKGLYVCLNIVDQAPDTWGIPSDVSLVNFMTERMEEMHEDGEFTKACARFPSPDQPYAHLGMNGNHGSVHDWKNAFGLWVQFMDPEALNQEA